jgi:2-methylcitrate dehydratase PrpD
MRQALRPSDLLRIEARITGAAFAEICEPVANKRRPQCPTHAQFSLPYALACVADHGTVTLADISEEGIRQEGVLALAERVHCVRDLELESRWGEKIGEAEVRVETRDGATFVARSLPPGALGRPMEEADLGAKVRECLAWGGSRLDTVQLTQCITALRYNGAVAELSRLLLSSATLGS